MSWAWQPLLPGAAQLQSGGDPVISAAGGSYAVTGTAATLTYTPLLDEDILETFEATPIVGDLTWNVNFPVGGGLSGAGTTNTRTTSNVTQGTYSWRNQGTASGTDYPGLESDAVDLTGYTDIYLNFFVTTTPGSVVFELYNAGYTNVRTASSGATGALTLTHDLVLAAGAGLDLSAVYIAFYSSGTGASDYYVDYLRVIPSAGGGSFTLTADAGTYSLTGTAASLERGVLVAANGGSYTITGTAADLEFNRLIAASSGSYAITGTAANLERASVVVADAGTYTITGTDASFVKATPIAADSGTYTITGDAADLERASLVTAASGSYAISGAAAGLEFSALLGAGAGSYSLTGTLAGLLSALEVAADGGSYTITGTDLDLIRDLLISADGGSYLLTGTDAGLNYASSSGLVAEAGAYAITGADLNFVSDLLISAEAGSYTITGQQADLLYYVIFAANTKLVTVGDSITQYGNLATSIKVSNQYDSVIHWALIDHPTFRHEIWYDPTATDGPASPLFRGANFGIAGDTATGVSQRLTPVINTGARVAVLLAGTNIGASDNDPAVAIARIESTITALTNANMTVIVSTILPRVVAVSPTGSEISPAQRDRILTINDAIRTMGVSPNVLVCDPWLDMIDTAYIEGDSLYGTAKADVTRDNVHLTPYGAFLAARGGESSLADCLSLISGTDLYDDTWFNSDPNDSANRLTNGELAGTSGVVNNGMTGTAPTSWVASCASGSGAVSGVSSVAANADTGGQSITLAFTSTGGGSATNNFEQCILSANSAMVDEPSIADGAWVKLFYKVDIPDNADGLLANIRAELRNSTTGQYGYGFEQTIANRATEKAPTDAWEGWIISEAVQYNSGNSFIPRLLIDIRDDIAGSISLRIDAALLLEVENPQVTFPYILGDNFPYIPIFRRRRR